jgi:hypothetical protein
VPHAEGMTTATKHPARRSRSSAWRLDPYCVDEFTLTLEEWRKRTAAAAVAEASPTPTYRRRPEDHRQARILLPIAGARK